VFYINNDKLRPSLAARDKRDLELKFVITSRPFVLGTLRYAHSTLNSTSVIQMLAAKTRGNIELQCSKLFHFLT